MPAVGEAGDASGFRDGVLCGRRPDRWDAVLAAWAALAAVARPLTAPAAVAVALTVVALAVIAMRRRRNRFSHKRSTRAPILTDSRGRVAVGRREVVPWVVLGVLLAVWEVLGLAWGNDAERPTLSLLLDPVLDTYPGRLAGWLAWLGVGRWLVTR